MEPSLGSKNGWTPPVGGDTLFANMEVARESTDEIKEKLEVLMPSMILLSSEIDLSSRESLQRK